MANAGKEFESDLKNSADKQGIYFYRIKDIPQIMLKANARVSQNDFDSFIYKYPNLFPIELKSTGQKSISFNNKIIKKHQIQALKEASEFDGIIAGFIFNFREYDNFTCFIHINDFLEIQYLSQKQISKHRFKSKLNKSSIGLDICKEVGTELHSEKKSKRYRYDVNKLLDEIIQKYQT